MATITIDVDLNEFSDDEILDHLKDAYIVIDRNDSSGPHQAMFRALSLGDEKQALDLLRNYLCDCLGRVI